MCTHANGAGAITSATRWEAALRRAAPMSAPRSLFKRIATALPKDPRPRHAPRSTRRRHSVRLCRVAAALASPLPQPTLSRILYGAGAITSATRWEVSLRRAAPLSVPRPSAFATAPVIPRPRRVPRSTRRRHSVRLLLQPHHRQPRRGPLRRP